MSNAQELRSLGNSKMKEANYVSALMHYSEAISIDPHSAPLYCNRAAALIQLGSMKDAENDLMKSLNYNPNYVPSLCRLGFLYLYEGNTIKSLENYVKAVQICSGQPHTLDRFKSQLKESVKLAESRARAQGYPQDYIDEIIPDTVRITLDSYRSLPTDNTDILNRNANSINIRNAQTAAANNEARPRGIAITTNAGGESLAELLNNVGSALTSGNTNIFGITPGATTTEIPAISPISFRFPNGVTPTQTAGTTTTAAAGAAAGPQTTNPRTTEPTIIAGPNGASAIYTVDASNANDMTNIFQNIGNFTSGILDGFVNNMNNNNPDFPNQNTTSNANTSNNTPTRSTPAPMPEPAEAARAAAAAAAAAGISTPQPSGSEPNLETQIPTNTSLPVPTGTPNDQNQRTSPHDSSLGSSHTTPSSDAMDEDPDVGVPDEETPLVSFNNNSTNTSTGATPTGNPTVTSFRIPFGQTTTTIPPTGNVSIRTTTTRTTPGSAPRVTVRTQSQSSTQTPSQGQSSTQTQTQTQTQNQNQSQSQNQQQQQQQQQSGFLSNVQNIASIASNIMQTMSNANGEGPNPASFAEQLARTLHNANVNAVRTSTNNSNQSSSNSQTHNNDNLEHSDLDLD
ncbi:hypothetical protein B5S28_g1582 [[Candida] boidinii]|nr:hypothetical protein B5S28_g1582 [[Candida] boidinii]OWB61115.1 hypothetical protein B5S29_g1999 [[Candida] boidinii]